MKSSIVSFEKVSVQKVGVLRVLSTLRRSQREGKIRFCSAAGESSWRWCIGSGSKERKR